MQINSLPPSTRNQVVLGMLSGMRASAGLIGTSILVRQQAGSYFSPSPLVRFFHHKNSHISLLLSGAAEMVVDKLPGTPDRIGAPMLSGRIMSGALSGATMASASGRKPVNGAIIGGSAAIASTFLFYYLRKKMSRALAVPDPLLGLAEDALAFAIGYLLVRSNQPKKARII